MHHACMINVINSTGSASNRPNMSMRNLLVCSKRRFCWITGGCFYWLHPLAVMHGLSFNLEHCKYAINLRRLGPQTLDRSKLCNSGRAWTLDVITDRMMLFDSHITMHTCKLKYCCIQLYIVSFQFSIDMGEGATDIGLYSLRICYNIIYRSL